MKTNKNTESMPLQYNLCEKEIDKQLHKLISTRHPDLANCKIICVWRNKPMKDKGTVIGAKIRKLNDCIRTLADYNFIIVIASPTWKELNDTQRTAILDHELCHIHYDEDKVGNPKYSLINHDVEDFAQIISLYGLYHSGLVEFGMAIREALASVNKSVVVKKVGDVKTKLAAKDSDEDDEDELEDDEILDDGDEESEDEVTEEFISDEV